MRLLESPKTLVSFWKTAEMTFGVLERLLENRNIILLGRDTIKTSSYSSNQRNSLTGN